MPSSSDLGAPSKPSGFETILTFLANVPLSPIETYINAVELMAVLSKMGWDSYIKQSTGLSGDNFQTEACVFPTLPGTGEASWLPAKYAISGLYKAGVEIAKTQRFQQLIVGLALKDIGGHLQSLGYLEFRPKKPKLGLQSYQTVETNVTELSYTNISVTAPPKPRVTDKTDKSFYITYDWNGHKLKSQDLFTAFLNALAIASVHDNDGIKAFVPNAPAASGDVILSTWSSGGPSADKLTWRRVKRAILLVWEEIITGGGKKGKARFEDFDFEIWYIPDGRGLVNGDKIGGGRVLKFGPDGPESMYGGVSNGTDGIAVSR